MKGKGMKKLAIVFIGAALALCMPGCQSTKTIECDGLSFSVPYSWGEIEETENGQHEIAMENGNDVLTVGSIDLPAEANPDEVLELSYLDIAGDESQSEMINVERFDIDGSPAMRGMVHTSYASGDKDYWGYVINFVTPANKHVYFSTSLEGENDTATVNTMKSVSESIRLDG